MRVGSLPGLSQQRCFSNFPLALHRYVPSFCFTHIVSFESAPNAVAINAYDAANKASDERALGVMLPNA